MGETLHFVPQELYPFDGAVALASLQLGEHTSPRFVSQTRHSSEIVEFPKSRERTLCAEMQYLRENWQSQNLPENWRFMPGTGFDVHLQTAMLFDELSADDAPDARREKLDLWLTRTDRDIVTFDVEYLARGLTFPISYKVISEEGRVIDPVYQKDVVEMISADERNGVVKETVEEKLVPFFLIAPEGSVAVMTSPEGWSGLYAPQVDPRSPKKPIIFPDSQTYVYQKVGDEIVGFTFRTDFSDEEHREVIKKLSGVELPLDAEIEKYVASVALLTPQEDFQPDIRLVAEVMREIRRKKTGKEYAWFDKDGGVERGWEEIFSDLQNKEVLYDFRGTSKRRCAQLKDFVLTKWNGTRRELDEAVAVTVLRISSELRKTQIQQKSAETPVMQVLHADADIRGEKIVERNNQAPVLYGAVLKDAQSLGGCNGGGQDGDIFTSQVEVLVESAGVPRNAFVSKDSLVLNEGFCTQCMTENTDDHYHCESADGTDGCKVKLSSDRGKSREKRRKECPNCKMKFNC